MATIRNYAVAQGVLTATGTTFVYSVPTGYALILKFLGIVNNANAAAAGQFGIQSPSTSSAVVLGSLALQAFQTALWSGWTVLNQGDRIYVNSDHQPTNYWAAGALLPYAIGLTSVADVGSQSPSPAPLPAQPDPAEPSPRPSPIYLPPTQGISFA